MSAEFDQLSLEMIEEGLVDHLVLKHNASPDELLSIRDTMPPSDWVAFLVRSHLMIHTIEDTGEYHDENLHFKLKDLP